MWIPRGHSKMWDCPGSEVWVPPEHSKSLKKAVLLVVQTVGLTTGTIAFSFSSTTITEEALGLVVYLKSLAKVCFLVVSILTSASNWVYQQVKQLAFSTAW